MTIPAKPTPPPTPGTGTAQTPRTDERITCGHDFYRHGYTEKDEMVPADFARTLERDLTTALKQLEQARVSLSWALSWAEIAIESEEEKGVKMAAPREWFNKHQSVLAALATSTPKEKP